MGVCEAFPVGSVLRTESKPVPGAYLPTIKIPQFTGAAATGGAPASRSPSSASDSSSGSSDLGPYDAPGNGPNATHLPTDQQATFNGYIKTPLDAIILLAACDLPWIKQDALHKGAPMPPRRITRRLLDGERDKLIHSGNIFVWDDREAGMRRWTDGRSWSASRVSGCFLLYREVEKNKSNSESPRGNEYKRDGLIKQSFSVTTASMRKLHVISYYNKDDVRAGLLRRVSEHTDMLDKLRSAYGFTIDEGEYGELLSRIQEGIPEDLPVPTSISPAANPVPRGVKRPTDAMREAYMAQESVAQPYSIPWDVAQAPGVVAQAARAPSFAPYGAYRCEAQHAPLPANTLGNSLLMGPPVITPTPVDAQPGPSIRREYTGPRNESSHTKLEHDSVEALVSLRTEFNVPREPTNPIVLSNPSSIQPSPNVSTTDRDALKKLSVRV